MVDTGVLAIGLTGLLLTVYADSVLPPIFLAAGIMFFLQAVTLWLVTVCRVQTFELLYALFTCKLGAHKNGSSGSSSRTSSNFAPKPAASVRLASLAATRVEDEVEQGVAAL